MMRVFYYIARQVWILFMMVIIMANAKVIGEMPDVAIDVRLAIFVFFASLVIVGIGMIVDDY